MKMHPIFMGALIVGTMGLGAMPVLAMDTLSGSARVVDGDTVGVVGIHVRLKGPAQAEMTPDTGGRPLTCALAGQKTHRRQVGVCTVDGIDIAAVLVQRVFDL